MDPYGPNLWTGFRDQELLQKKKAEENAALEANDGKNTRMWTDEVVRRTLGRAGIEVTQKNIDHITDALINQSKTGPNETTNMFHALMGVGDPNTSPESFQGIKVYGVPAEELRERMMKGYTGRGWSPSEQKELGRTPERYERSPGQKQADQWAAQKQFMDSLLAESTPHDRANAVERMKTQLFQPDDLQRTWEMLGETSASPEYTLPTPTGLLESLDKSSYQHSRALAGMDEWAQAAQHFMWDDGGLDSLDRAKKQNIIWQNGARESPLLNKDFDNVEDREAHYLQWKAAKDDARPQDYDDYHRQRYGYYPSYAWSSAMNFLGNTPDPMTLIGAGLLTRPVTTLMKGMTPAGLTITGLSKPSVKSLAQGSAAQLGREIGEEIPTSVALQGGTLQYQHSQNAKTPTANQSINPAGISPGNMLTSGNNARTDRYVRSEGYGDGWGPETAGQFKHRMQQEDEAQKSAYKLLEESLLHPKKQATKM